MKKLLKNIVLKFKKYNYKVISSRENVEYSLESKDKTKFIEILSTIDGFYCNLYGFNQKIKSLSFLENEDLNKIDDFLIKN